MGLNKESGIKIGRGTPGQRNLITDVPGVKVGHVTIRDGADINTGVTAILPHEGNLFQEKVMASSCVINGFGKTMGLVQVEELGTIETPIIMTNTLSIGTAATALIKYMLQQNEDIGVKTGTVNPLVCECNDGSLNDIRALYVKEEHVLGAIENCADTFEEGAVGAGTGMCCLGFKGGIGSASRLLDIAGKTYTLGVLVQSNHGTLEELHVMERPLGREIIAARKAQETAEPNDRGSIMMIVATDLPVSDRQLRRILKRCSVGLARNGSYFGHGSGDVMIGFTTANRVPHGGMHRVISHQILTEHTLELAFRAAAESTQEAVLNSMVAAKTMTALSGKVYESITCYL